MAKLVVYEHEDSLDCWCRPRPCSPKVLGLPQLLMHYDKRKPTKEELDGLAKKKKRP